MQEKSTLTSSGDCPPFPRGMAICDYQEECGDFSRTSHKCRVCNNNKYLKPKKSYFEPKSSSLWTVEERKKWEKLYNLLIKDLK